MLPPIEDFLSGKIKTIGWQVLDWCSKWLVNPDSYGGEKGAPWVFTEDQAHFVLAFYSVDASGRWIYRRAYRERAKGAGKSPMVAAIACAEFLGPSQFSHWDENGNPVGSPHKDAIVWLAATSLDGTDHTYAYVLGMLEGKAERKYGLELGMTRILVKTRKKNTILKQITASPKSHEGPKPTFVICEETHYWTPAEHGQDLEGVIHRGLMKTKGRRIEVTNAPAPGQGSVAENTHDFYQKVLSGEARSEGLLFDTFSIHVEDIYDEDQAMEALGIIYEHAHWIDRKRVFEDILDPSHSEVDSRRFFFNEIVAPVEMWIKAKYWDACIDTGLKLFKKDKIALGFRIKSSHACSVVACRLVDNAIFPLKTWERPEHGPREWEVPAGEVDKFVRRVLKDYNVVYMTTSPNGFQDIIPRWIADFPDVTFEAIWMDRGRQKHADAVDLFERAVLEGRILQNGDDTLRRHLLNCFVTEWLDGQKLIRPETLYSKRYIVAAESAVLSVQAAQAAIEDGALDDGLDDEFFTFS